MLTQRAAAEAEKILWLCGPISCTCVTTLQGATVSLWVRDVRLESRAFEDYEQAAQYAINKLHVYGVAQPWRMSSTPQTRQHASARSLTTPSQHIAER
jgi:hypothetical protein